MKIYKAQRGEGGKRETDGSTPLDHRIALIAVDAQFAREAPDTEVELTRLTGCRRAREQVCLQALDFSLSKLCKSRRVHHLLENLSERGRGQVGARTAAHGCVLFTRGDAQLALTRERKDGGETSPVRAEA